MQNLNILQINYLFFIIFFKYLSIFHFYEMEINFFYYSAKSRFSCQDFNYIWLPLFLPSSIEMNIIIFIYYYIHFSEEFCPFFYIGIDL